MLILRRSYCISTVSGIVILFRRLFSTQVKKGLLESFLNLCTEYSPEENDDVRGYTNTIRTPEDEHNSVRNKYRNVVNVLK